MRYIKALFLVLFFAFALLFFMENFKSLSTPLPLKLDLFITYSTSSPAPESNSAVTPAPAGESAMEEGKAPAEAAEPAASAQIASAEAAKPAHDADPVVPAGKKRLFWKAEAVPLYFVVIAAFVAGVLIASGIFILGRLRMTLDAVKQSRRVKAMEKSLLALKAKASRDQEVAGKQIKELEGRLQKKSPLPETTQVV